MLPQSMLFHRFRPIGVNSDNFIGTATSGADNCLYDYLNICCLSNINQLNVILKK